MMLKRGVGGKNNALLITDFKNYMKKQALASCLILVGVQAVLAQNKPAVSFSVSGTSGDYTLDFTVDNTLLAWPDQNVYFFGVQVNGATTESAPGGWSFDGSWNPSADPSGSGPNIPFNESWITGGSGISTGTSLSGFDVTTTSATMPTNATFFAYSFGSDLYTGPDNFKTTAFLNPSANPGFLGTAFPSAAPDGGETFGLLSLSLAALTGLSRRFRKA
jgi:hypothetical protein